MVLLLEDDIDIVRGDVIVGMKQPAYVGKELEAVICWMSEVAMNPEKVFTIKHGSNYMRARVSKLQYRVDVETLQEDDTATTLRLNEIGRFSLKLAKPIVYDPYRKNRRMGSFIIVDESSNVTVGAGMLREPVGGIVQTEYQDYVI